MGRLSGEERRAQIIEGALEVILEKGLAGTATRDVTRQLGVGSGLLHHYFDTWRDLRSEVVRRFVRDEIADLKSVVSKEPKDAVFDRFVEWMTSDPEFRFWKLWLDAVEEARRDPQLAEIVQESYLDWHAAIVEILSRADMDGESDGVSNAAWRISAIIDGLMGMLVLDQKTLTPALVKQLLAEQIEMERGKTA